MKLSLSKILSLVDNRGLSNVFASVMPEKLLDPDYSLTQSDVELVTAKLEQMSKAIPEIGVVDLFGQAQTPDTWFAARNDLNQLAEALRQLIKIIGVGVALPAPTDSPSCWLNGNHLLFMESVADTLKRCGDDVVALYRERPDVTKLLQELATLKKTQCAYPMLREAVSDLIVALWSKPLCTKPVATRCQCATCATARAKSLLGADNGITQ